MTKSPFKFLDTYAKEDRDIFFGRDREIEELYSRVFLSNILLIFGVSGTGKSSLINCGLGNKFQDSDWLPVFIRKGTDINDSLRQALARKALTPAKEGRSLKKIIQSLYLDHFKPVYLIFDQFEELFIFGTDDEKKTFIQQVKTIAESDLHCRFIFSMREEYLANITEFEHEIPTFLDNRIRIEKMIKRHAKEVIEGPCKVAGIALEEGFADNLLERLAPGSPDVELTYLQVFLDKIYRIALGKNLQKLIFSNALLAELGKIDDILGSFLEEQIAQLEDPDTGMAMLKSFVSVKGTKKQVTENEIKDFCHSLGKDLSDAILTDYLQKFISLRILRDKDENGKYELRHDSLAAKIYEKITVVEKELIEIRQFIENAFDNYNKRKILLSEDDLMYIAPYQDKLFLSRGADDFIAKSKFELGRVKRRRRNIAVAAAAVLFVVLSGFTVWAMVERSKAEAQRNIAVTNSEIARSNELASYCMLNLERNPTLSFRLAEESYRTRNSKLAMEALTLAYETATYNPLHVTLSGHTGLIYTVDYHPGSEAILTSSFDNTAKLWTLDGKEKRTLEGHQARLFSARFSKDGNYILTASHDSTAKIWDAEGNFLATLKDSSQKIFQADFSKDGSLIATASPQGNVSLWRYDKINGKCNKIFDLKGHKGSVLSIAVSSDDQMIVTTSKDKTAKIWNFDGKELAVLTGHTDEVNHASFSPDNRMIVTCADDKTARIWDLKGNIQKVLKGHTGQVFRASFSPDGSYIVTVSNDGNAIVWDKDGNILNVLKAGLGALIRFAISPDGKSIATAADNGISQVWEFPGKLLYELKRHESNIWDIKFIENNTIVTVSQDETAKVWSIGNREARIVNESAGKIYESKYKSDRKELIVKKGSLAMIDMTNQRLVNFGNYMGASMKAEFSLDGKFLITASEDKTIRIWDFSGSELAQIKHTHAVGSASFSPDGNTVLSAGGDGIIRTFDRTGNELNSKHISFESLNHAVYSPDGKIIAAVSKQKSVTLLDDQLQTLKKLENLHSEPLKAVFSPDGERIVTGFADGKVLIWDKAGNQSNELGGHSTPVIRIAFSNDGSYFFTLSEKPYLIQVWNAEGELQTVINLGKAPDTEHFAQFDENNRQLIVFTATRGKIFIKRWPLQTDLILEMVNGEKVLGNVRQLTEEEKIEFNIGH